MKAKTKAEKDGLGVYLIVLQGGGDTYAKVVDEETYNWVTSDDMGQPQDMEDENCWEDQLVPASQVTKLKALGDGDAYPLMITSGSWENDRAIAARCMDGYEECDTVAEALDDIRRNGHKLVDQYNGCMY